MPKAYTRIPKSYVIRHRVKRPGRQQKPRRTCQKTIKLAHREVEKALFVHKDGWRLFFARRNDVPRYWWYVNWIQNRYQPSGPFMTYEEAWHFACRKLGLYHIESAWKLVGYRCPLGTTWRGITKPDPASPRELERRMRLKELWDYNRAIRIKRGGVLGRGNGT